MTEELTLNLNQLAGFLEFLERQKDSPHFLRMKPGDCLKYPIMTPQLEVSAVKGVLTPVGDIKALVFQIVEARIVECKQLNLRIIL